MLQETPETNTPWGGVERRTKQLPVGPTALKIAGRTAEGGKEREGDFLNQVLKAKVDGILSLAASDEAEPASAQKDTTTKPSEPKKPEQTPEQAYLGKFKTRFEALPQLHAGIQWADVEKSLKADPEQLRKLQILDEKGHNMNVFGEENGEFVFVSAWSDYNKVSTEHRNVSFDLEGQKLAEKRGDKPTGNAVDIVESIGADLADPKFHEQLRKTVAVNGWVWLKTDAATRKTGYAFNGLGYGIPRFLAGYYYDYGSFRAALRVKKA